jgi:hypothetical protein
MRANPAIVIPHGNPAAVFVEWLQANGVPSDPVSVQYQVFDFITKSVLSPVVQVPAAAAEMSFEVSPEYLPSGAVPRRRLVIQMQAVFLLGGQHTELLEVYVERGYTFTS